MNNAIDELQMLFPTSNQNIMEVVRAAGIDVSPWRVNASGNAVASPASNPKYCYEWAFGGGKEPTLLCVWHNSLKVSDGKILYEDAPRQFAQDLERVSTDPTRKAEDRNRARTQANRARAFDSLAQRAFWSGSPVRVVVVDGEQREVTELGRDSSLVRTRLLDTETWYVHSYDVSSGTLRIVRGVKANPIQLEDVGSKYVDQIQLPEPPEKVDASGTAYSRSAQVRAQVLQRAAGACERCRCPGFKTSTGAIFLETHHVIPLSEGGIDEPWNVAAICANDHREAHHGLARKEIRDALLARLRLIHPEAAFAIDEMVRKHNERLRNGGREA